jgi:cytoskeleton protein RodZ
MNDHSSNNEEETTGPLGGERLRAARRENDISVRDIAKELHLDEPKVRALEENSFELLGAPVFAKGHLRKYAELVGVSVDDILADYYQLNRSAGAPPVVGPKRVQPRDISLGPWILGGMLAIVVAGTAFWWFTREPQVEDEAAVEPATLAPFASQGEDDSLPIDLEADNTSDLAAASVESGDAEDSPAVMESAPLLTEPVIQDASDSLLPQVQVELTYSGDCWTEASDASGRRLFYDLGSAGRVVTIGGDAPIRIVLGDGDNVSIRVEGRDYPIPNSARSGRLARLTINRPLYIQPTSIHSTDPNTFNRL